MTYKKTSVKANWIICEGGDPITDIKHEIETVKKSTGHIYDPFSRPEFNYIKKLLEEHSVSKVRKEVK